MAREAHITINGTPLDIGALYDARLAEIERLMLSGS